MQSTLTRRTMLKTVTGGGIAALAGSRMVTALAAQPDIDSGGIGLMRANWEAIAGEGTAVGDLVEYSNPQHADTNVLAQYDDSDRVIHLDFEYAEGETGGLPEDEVRAQIDSAMPSDAELMETFAITQANLEATQYRVQRFISKQLGAMSHGGASILVIMQQGAGPTVTRVSLTMPGPHTMEAREVGNPGGIGLSRAEWNELYGEPEPTQGGDVYDNAVIPGFPLMVQFKPGDRANLVQTSVAGEMTPSVGYADAKGLVGSLLPDDAILRDVFLVPSPPERMMALSAELWECPSLSGVTDEIGSVLALYEQAVDTNPVTVSRIAVSLPIDLEERQDATPGASPETAGATPVVSPGV